MKRAGVTIVAVLLSSCAGVPAGPVPACPDTDTAQGAVCAFYTTYLEVRPSGLPTPAQEAALEPWLSTRLETRLADARRVQADFRERHPGEKPPLVDGCLFASLFEGPTSFTVGIATAAGGVTRVPVRFRYGSEAQWEDVIVLTREGGAYVIDDIEFAGAGPFNPPGRLSDRLEPAGE
jgi:hypothetical protein